MNDRAIGLGLRALRRRQGLRQVDVAVAARTHQSVISAIEAGNLASLRIEVVRRVFAALGADLALVPSWRGGGLDRLLDERHAALVETVVAKLRRLGWQVEVEVTYSKYGERGSIDVLGFHRSASAVLMAEVKSELVSIEGTIRPMDVKSRLAPMLAQERFGSRSVHVGRLLALPESSTARRRASDHARTLDAAFPLRGAAVRSWLRQPQGPMSGIWFLSPIDPHDARRRPVTPQRVRVPRIGRPERGPARYPRPSEPARAAHGP